MGFHSSIKVILHIPSLEVIIKIHRVKINRRGIFAGDEKIDPHAHYWFLIKSYISDVLCYFVILSIKDNKQILFCLLYMCTDISFIWDTKIERWQIKLFLMTGIKLPLIETAHSGFDRITSPVTPAGLKINQKDL